MADLQGLRDLLEKAEALDSEVERLEVTKADLEQDKITLSAKRSHIETQIKQLEDDLKGAVEDTDTRKALKEGELAEIEGKKQIVLKEYNELLTSKLAAKQGFDTEQLANQEALEALEQSLEKVGDEIIRLEATRDSLLAKISGLRENVASLKENITDLQSKQLDAQKELSETLADVSTQTEDAKSTLASINDTINDRDDKLTYILKQIEEAETTLAESKKKHDDFVLYEERARKSLEARESSLDARQAQLDEDIRLHKRRSSVLDKL